MIREGVKSKGGIGDFPETERPVSPQGKNKEEIKPASNWYEHDTGLLKIYSLSIPYIVLFYGEVKDELLAMKILESIRATERVYTVLMKSE